MKRNPNRGVVLCLHEAAAIHRMLEFYMDGRRFDNPIVAFETKNDCAAAKDRLEQKLIAIFTAHAPYEEPASLDSVGRQ